MFYLYGIVLTHIVGGASYHYSGGNEYFLIPGVLLILYNMYNYTKVSVLVLSPHWNIELEYDEESTWKEKFLVQSSSIITLAYIYKAGYMFAAGLMSFYAIVVLLSLIITVANIDMSEGGDE